MKLYRLTERIWVFPYEEARDRPNLAYIRGDRWSLAVDAGHSRAHAEAFYAALEGNDLPLPALTVLTHWHWDHTFGMHAVHGLCLANAQTNEHLLAFREKIAREGREAFLGLDARIRAEYAGDRPIVITPADMVFAGEMQLDAGSCPIRVFQAESPHTDDATLVHATDEGVLCVGDATCGEFPTWETDAALAGKLASAIEATGAQTCLLGHWTPLSLKETLADLAAET